MIDSKQADIETSRQVSHVLSQHGLRPPCHVEVSSSRGVVTLSGSLQYDFQRHMAVRCARSVTGVRRVIDQLKVPQAAIWR